MKINLKRDALLDLADRLSTWRTTPIWKMSEKDLAARGRWFDRMRKTPGGEAQIRARMEEEMNTPGSWCILMGDEPAPDDLSADTIVIRLSVAPPPDPEWLTSEDREMLQEQTAHVRGVG
jgi:hypothetical protein